MANHTPAGAGGADGWNANDAIGADKRTDLINTNEDHLIIIDRWFNKQRDLGILAAHYLTALQCQELHRLGYDPEDLFNGNAVGNTAGHVNVKDPTNLANYLEDFANIAGRSKFGT